MAVLKVITEPDPLLHKISAPVEKVDAKVREFLEDMLETMYAYDGIGLAAVQVGVLKRILVIDLAESSRYTPESIGGPLKIVNPEILWVSDRKGSLKEGCLSVPEHYIDVERPAEIKIRYQDEAGRTQELFANGLLAICLQHEIDHLNGITILSRSQVPLKEQKLAEPIPVSS